MEDPTVVDQAVADRVAADQAADQASLDFSGEFFVEYESSKMCENIRAV